MYSLPRPAVTANEIYAVSFSKIRSVELRERHELESMQVHRASKQLEEAAITGYMETLDPEDFQPIKVSVKEMVNLFERGLQAKNGPGRWFYEEVASAAPNEQCPYCGERRVESIDHYLPKTDYSTLAVDPRNLVPACSDCNRFKGSYRPSQDKAAVLHPYFDSVDSFRWLYAELEESRPPRVRFKVKTEHVQDEVTAARIGAHFRVFKLGDLYASHAGQTIRRLERRLPKVFREKGAWGVREQLWDEAEIHSDGRANSWARALHECLAESDWYCSKYFEQSDVDSGMTDRSSA